MTKQLVTLVKPPVTTAKQAVNPIRLSESNRSHWSPGSNKTPTPVCQTTTQAGEPVSKHPVNFTKSQLPPYGETQTAT
jgi:hypothetical protein